MKRLSSVEWRCTDILLCGSSMESINLLSKLYAFFDDDDDELLIIMLIIIRILNVLAISSSVLIIYLPWEFVILMYVLSQTLIFEVQLMYLLQRFLH